MSNPTPLKHQIEELRRELLVRSDAYPRLIRAGKMRQNEAGYYRERMQAALQSLVWLERNEDRIKVALFLLSRTEAGQP